MLLYNLFQLVYNEGVFIETGSHNIFLINSTNCSFRHQSRQSPIAIENQGMIYISIWTKLRFYSSEGPLIISACSFAQLAFSFFNLEA